MSKLDKKEKVKGEEIKFEIEMGANIRLDDGCPPSYRYSSEFRTIRSDWAIDESSFIDFTKNTPIEKDSLFHKIKSAFSTFYYNLLYLLWLIKHIITKK